MKNPIQHSRRGGLIAVIFTTTVLVAASAASAQVTAKPAHVPEHQCIDCHRQPFSNERSSAFIVTNAAEIWHKHDQHRHAFSVLNLPVNQARVTNMLGFKLEEAFEDKELRTLSSAPDRAEKVTKLKSCLTCHSSYQSDFTDEHDIAAVDIEKGVSCQACHGQASKWVSLHQEPWWRRVDSDTKHKLGMQTLREPATKAKLCNSCHVGDAAQSKMVTHDMYALGHPPLPSFEASSAIDRLPAHWRSLKSIAEIAKADARAVDATALKKSAALVRSLAAPIAEDKLAASLSAAIFPESEFGKRDVAADLPRTKTAVFSGIAAAQSYLSLTLATANQPKRDSWPEFATFQCASCHHELKKSDRRDLAKLGPFTQGRPHAIRWTRTLPLLIAQSLDRTAANPSWTAKIQSGFEALDEAMTGKVFGDSAAVSLASQGLLQDLAELTSALKKQPIDKTFVEGLRSRISGPNASLPSDLDFHSARQVAWVYGQIALDLNGADLQPGERRNDAHAAASAAPFLLEGKDFLLLNSSRTTSGESLLKAAKDRLQSESAFDSEKFRKMIQEIAVPSK